MIKKIVMYGYRCSTPFTIHYNFTFTSRSLQWLRSNTKWTSYSTESPLYPDPTLYQKNPPITSRIRTEPMARGMTGYPVQDLRYRTHTKVHRRRRKLRQSVRFRLKRYLQNDVDVKINVKLTSKPKHTSKSS